MKTITYKLKDLEEKKEKKVTLKLGYVGENEHVQIRIDCAEIWKDYPAAVASLAVEPPEGDKYPAIVTRDGDVVCWTVKDSDLVKDGYGRIQLTFTEGSEVQKTVICRTKVDESIVGSGTAPDPIADFVAEANEALAELEAAEIHGPVIGEDGYWYTWSKDAGEYVKTDTKAQGEDGPQGPAGKDGADGAPGQDGHTPVKGTDYWTQQDQADIVEAAALETVSAVIDDTAGDGDTDKTWSADKIAETTGQLLNAIQGKPDEKESTKSGVDLDISDENGNVIMRLKNGEIETKKFNSSKASIEKESAKTGVDLDVSDENGNVILRAKNGNVETKNFDSSLIRQLKDKKWACIGDSLTEVNSRTTMHYHDYIHNETGIQVVNMGHSGCGYDYVGGYGKNFIGIAAEVTDDVDVITIFGSGNDLNSSKQLGDITDSTTDTICGCINATLDVLYEDHPTKPLGVITPTPWQGREPSDASTDLKNYCEAIVQICERRGIPCLDLYHCSNLHPSDSSFRPLAYSKDDGNGVHPDETGHLIITPRIRQFLFNLI